MDYQLNSTKFLTREEDARLLKLLSTSRNELATQLKLLRFYGMRSGELLALRLMDINKDEKTIYIRGSKRSNDRELPLNDEIFIDLLKSADGCVSEKSRIFNISYWGLKKRWDVSRFRPGKKKLHSLRHTFGVEMYKKTKDIKMVQKLMGHRSIRNTMIYVDFQYTQDQFRKALVG